MGLLGNGWDDPQSQAMMALAGGLLSGNFGKGASDYGAIMGAAPDVALKRQMLKEELAMKQLAEKRAQGLFDMQQREYADMAGGQAKPVTIPGQMSTPQLGGVDMFSQGTSVTSPPQTVTPQANPNDMMARLTRQSILGMPGVSDRINLFKYGQEGVQREPGKVYQMPDGTTQYGPPSIDKNMQLAPDGKGGYSVRPATGATAAVKALSAADAEGKAGFDMIEVKNGTDAPVLMSKAEYARSRALGTAPQTPPPSAPLGRTGATPAGVPVKQGYNGYEGGSQASANAEAIKIMQAELLKPGNSPEDIAGIKREIGRLQMQSGAAPKQSRLGTGMTQDEQDASAVDLARRKTSAETGVKAGIERIMSGYDNARTALDTISSIGESRKAIQGGVYAGAGADVKLNIAKGIQAFGLGFAVDPEKVTNTDYLNSNLGQGILNKAKTLGANPTDNDARIIRDIVGSIGKDPQALNKLLDYQEVMARRAIDNHNKNYGDAKSRGFDAGFDLTVDHPKTAKAEPMDTMPKANPSNKGRKLRDTTTGKILQSNGMSWVEVQ